MIRAPLVLGLILSFFCAIPRASAVEPAIVDGGSELAVDAIFPAEHGLNLQALSGKKAEIALARYQKAKAEAKELAARNLLNLAIGYIHLRNENARVALESLGQIAGEDFLLEDYRLYFRSLAYHRMGGGNAVKKAGGNRDRQNWLERSLQDKLALQQKFPESPLLKHLPEEMAELEAALGEAHHKRASYAEAARWYRRALRREFPNNASFRLRTHKALARVYEDSASLSEATELYAYLLKYNDSKEIRVEAARFAQKNEVWLRDRKGDARFLLAALKGGEAASGGDRPTVEAPRDTAAAAGNEDVRELQELLRQNDRAALQRAVKVYLLYAGVEPAPKLLKDVQRLLLAHFQEGRWDSGVDQLADLFPAAILSDFALQLWKNSKVDEAATAYQKILQKYPLEVESCHKALFFLGRIYEDKGDYPLALEYYQDLLRRYDSGAYTVPALFKIPWLLRLQAKNEEAVAGFERVIGFMGTPRAAALKALYPGTAAYLPAAHYWMAKTLEYLGKAGERTANLNILAQRHALDFYGIVARWELGLSVAELVNYPDTEIPVLRRAGGGPAENTRLRRVEHLLAAGFQDFAKAELAYVSAADAEGDAFAGYIASLAYRAGDFQRGVKLTGEILERRKDKAVPQTLARIAFPKAYFEPVEAAGRQWKVDPFLALALMRQESAFNAEAVSLAKAVGLMQLILPTARETAQALNRDAPDAERLKDPEVNVALGMHYLHQLLQKFDHNLILALAAYNAGPHKVKEWMGPRMNLSPLEFIENIPYVETQGYVKRVLRNYFIYLALYKGREIKSINEILTIRGEY